MKAICKVLALWVNDTLILCMKAIKCWPLGGTVPHKAVKYCPLREQYSIILKESSKVLAPWGNSTP